MKKAASAILAAIVMVASVASQANADWKVQYNALTIGVPPIENASEGQARYAPLADYLSAKLGVPVTLRMASAYSGIIQAMEANEVDMAMYGAAAFAAADDVLAGDLQPLAHAAAKDGTLGYQAIVITRADSGINTLEDLKGKTLAYADPNSASGYLVPSYYFNQMNMGKDFFASTTFSGGHENSILAVVRGTYDAAATWHYTETNGAVQRMVDRGEVPAGAVKVIWESPLVPADAWSVRASMPDDLKAALTDALVSFASADPEKFAVVSAGSWANIVPVGREAFEDSIAMRKAMLANRGSSN
ncbi:phosphate/phosphite/phosphonate ABC transporter substrate-binding protein [Paenirhodobacter populi]|uniref:Phosphate/phosphite/phosphonate ABC transporter substrate-binding protein n=1 Tax=Paenirhodobacter populi TaxID=2306993 RepID=A0A443J7N3_9RHOB|nr:phosphate/phosphite/phosphonate ABC transporter substrate-binding protein [Sinirhodobacter populi]RWR16502.1 phosphate/phosphite/phosphonate ABC transporter substrate-binding protein [Sinirhodobacter populi]